MKKKYNIFLTILVVLLLASCAGGSNSVSESKDNPPAWLCGKVWSGNLTMTAGGVSEEVPDAKIIEVPANATFKDLFGEPEEGINVSAVATSDSYTINMSAEMTEKDPEGKDVTVKTVVSTKMTKVSDKKMTITGSYTMSAAGESVSFTLNGEYKVVDAIGPDPEVPQPETDSKAWLRNKIYAGTLAPEGDDSGYTEKWGIPFDANARLDMSKLPPLPDEPGYTITLEPPTYTYSKDKVNIVMVANITDGTHVGSETINITLTRNSDATVNLTVDVVMVADGALVDSIKLVGTGKEATEMPPMGM